MLFIFSRYVLLGITFFSKGFPISHCEYVPEVINFPANSCTVLTVTSANNVNTYTMLIKNTYVVGNFLQLKFRMGKVIKNITDNLRALFEKWPKKGMVGGKRTRRNAPQDNGKS